MDGRIGRIKTTVTFRVSRFFLCQIAQKGDQTARSHHRVDAMMGQAGMGFVTGHRSHEGVDPLMRVDDLHLCRLTNYHRARSRQVFNHVFYQPRRSNTADLLIMG